MTNSDNNGFYNLGISPNLLNNIRKLKFDTPTPIQKDAIPAGIQGDDIIGLAQTGSGKTIAYGIPMLQRLSKSKDGVGLVLVPTRELAIQVEESIRSISRATKIRSIVIIGGAAMSVQINGLRRKPRIIIATPGRLMDHLERGTVNLSYVDIFVLDEADRMLDMGFVPDIKKIMKSIPEEHQTMLFSATMPDEIEDIAKTLMEDPIRIDTDRSGDTPSEISHELFFVSNIDKKRLLAVQLKQYPGPVLIFTRTKRMASKLTDKIKDMGFAAAEIHSNRSLVQRRNALDGFKRGRYQILVATDIAARGIDVTGIELVVNYDMPANSEDYVHRIGRTGRAGKAGHAISYASAGHKRSIMNLEKFMNIKLEVSALPDDLPTERSLLHEAHLLHLTNDLSTDDDSPKRKRSKKSSFKRGAFKKKEPKKFVPRRHQSKNKESGQEDSAKKDSSRTGSGRKDSNRTSSRRKDSIWKDSKRKKSKSKVSKTLNERLNEFTQSVANTEDPVRPDFEKKWPKKKKSVGQGARRKKRKKRK